MIRTLLVFVIVSALQISGCSSFKVANAKLIKADAYKSVKADNISPAEAIFQAEKALKDAKDAGLDFYSPLHIEKAEKQITKAHSLLRLRSTKRSRIAAATAAVIAVKVISAAKDNKKKVASTLVSILNQKKVLDEMNVAEGLKQRYLVGMKKINALIRLVERGKYDRVVELERPTLSYLNKLEANMLKVSSLASAKGMLIKAKSLRAQKYASKTYSHAVASYKDALVFIDGNYKDRAAVAHAANQVFASASHAFYVAMESQKIIHSDAMSIETYILAIQKHLSHINENLGISNLHSHSFKQQAKLIHDAIALKEDNKSLNSDAEKSLQKKREFILSGKEVLPAENAVSSLPAMKKSKSASMVPEVDAASAARKINDVKSEKAVDELALPSADEGLSVGNVELSEKVTVVSKLVE